MEEDKEKNWLEDLEKNPEYKAKFLNGLNRLGFPLEFKIRKRLVDLGFNNVQEGFFSVIEQDGKETVKTFDFSAYKTLSTKILNEITIHLDIQLVGDCKNSIDRKKFLFAIPESGKIENKLFLGPILSNMQSANYGVYRNMEVASQFISKYGQIYLASDVKDTSKDYITGDEKKSKDDTPDYERIHVICERTIIPALFEKFKRWRSAAINDYARIFTHALPINGELKLEWLKNEFFAFRVLIPMIVTTKPILIPVLENGGLKDVKQIDFLLYEHSVMNPDKYFELMFNAYDVGVFIATEKGFDKLMEYIENIAKSIFKEITTNLSRHPNRLYEDFEEMNKQDKEAKDRLKIITEKAQ